MARGLSVRVEVPPELTNLEGQLAARAPRLLSKAAALMRDEVARVAPGGPSRSIARSFRVETQARTSIVRGTHPGAKALDRGAFIVPTGLKGMGEAELRRQPRRLVFQVDGRTVFVPFVRLKGTGYVRKALRRRKRIVNAAFEAAYGDYGKR